MDEELGAELLAKVLELPLEAKFEVLEPEETKFVDPLPRLELLEETPPELIGFPWGIP